MKSAKFDAITSKVDMQKKNTIPPFFFLLRKNFKPLDSFRHFEKLPKLIVKRKNIYHLVRNSPFATVTRNSLPYIFDMVTISVVCHQKPHSLQPNQIYGNLVTNIPKY
jgi:hypothetical protein